MKSIIAVLLTVFTATNIIAAESKKEEKKVEIKPAATASTAQASKPAEKKTEPAKK